MGSKVVGLRGSVGRVAAACFALSCGSNAGEVGDSAGSSGGAGALGSGAGGTAGAGNSGNAGGGGTAGRAGGACSAETEGTGGAVNGRGPDAVPSTSERPVLFLSAHVATNVMTLWAARTGGTVTMLATREAVHAGLGEETWDGYHYHGPTNRLGGFPYMSPYWENMSASPDGTWVLWQREDLSWDVLDGRDGRPVPLPKTRWGGYRSDIVWSPDGTRFLGFDPESCTLQVAEPSSERVTQLARLGDASSCTNIYPRFSWSGDGSRIAYSSYAPVTGVVLFSTGELHSVRPDGTDDRLIAPRAALCRAGDRFPSPWSADGTSLVYATISHPDPAEPAGTVQFRTARSDGSDSTLVAEFDLAEYDSSSLKATAATCEWSPRGDRLLVNSPSGLFSVAARGTELRQLSQPGALPYEFSWSPDGAWIAVREVEAPEDLASHSLLYLIRFDGSGRRLLSTTHAPDSVEWGWRWSGDGSHGVHGMSLPGGGFELHLLDLDSASDVLLSDASEPDYGWTPDGTRILYVKPEPSGASVKLAAVRPDGSDSSTLSIPAISRLEMMWLLNGEYLSGADQDSLWIANFRSGERFLPWTNTACERLVDVANWDHVPSGY